MEKKQFVLTLDLIPDPVLIAQYEAYHRSVWPEIEQSIRDAGITKLEIFRYENRLCMFLETQSDFSWARKSEMDQANPWVQRWEDLMWNYQQAVPTAAPGEKWMLMDKIYELLA